jgi:5'-phosphate synthase pdxT subunit
MQMKPTIGVLALQGDFERHIYRLKNLSVSVSEIRQVSDLDNLDGLIIPGGESTTINNLIARFGLRKPLSRFARTHSVWGTCAGMIMLARQVDDPRVDPLGIIDISIIRNGYGRQVHSFFATVEASLNGTMSALSASFIRAPLVKSYGRDVSVLARYQSSPVLLSHENCLVSSFHTELDDDLTLTKFFVDKFVLK